MVWLRFRALKLCQDDLPKLLGVVMVAYVRTACGKRTYVGLLVGLEST